LAGEGEIMPTSDALLGEIRQLQAKKHHGASCSVLALKRNLDKEALAALLVAFDDETIDAVTIATWLTSKGHKVNSWTVNRHRRSLCSCEQR